MRHSLFTLALAFALSAAPALAQEFKAGDIVVEKPWARATPKGAEVGSGYLTIQNKGAAPDRLTGGSADFATVEIHQMSSENGVSQMRQTQGRAEHSRQRFGRAFARRLSLDVHAPHPSADQGRERQSDAQFRTCWPGRSRVQRDGDRRVGNWRDRRRHEGHEDVTDFMRPHARSGDRAQARRPTR